MTSFINNPDMNRFIDSYNQISDGRGISVKTAKIVYDFDVAGGTIGTIDSLVEIPANAVVTRAWVDSLVTATSASDAGTMAIQLVSADDIVAAIAIVDGTNPWDAGLHEGIPVGTMATSIKLTAASTIKFVIAVEDFTDGKFNVFIEYVVSE